VSRLQKAVAELEVLQKILGRNTYLLKSCLTLKTTENHKTIPCSKAVDWKY